MMSLPAPDGNSAGKRKERHGEAQHRCKTPKTPLSKLAYIPQVVHKEIMEYAELCRGSSPDSHWDQAFFFAYPPVYKRSQVVYIIFWPRGLLTFLWLSSWIIVQKTPFPWKCFLFTLHHPQSTKELHSYRTKVQWVITKKVLNSKI